jgi:spore photoproduct lyase
MIYININSKNGYFHKQLEALGHKFQFVNNEKDFIENSTIKKTIYISKASQKDIHPCPGTKYYRCCNYHVFDLVSGCPFDCTYCVLQALIKDPYISVYENLEDLTNNLELLNSKGRYRISTGEMSDSLALDSLLRISNYIIPKINKLDNILFEFKTKSGCINNLLHLNPKNIIISWSLNPEDVIQGEEHKTASLNERLAAAKICSDYGYKIALHFDPLIFCENFEEEYKLLIKKAIDNLKESSVLYISLSTLRFLPEITDMIRLNFTDTKLLSSNFIYSLDGKLRYFKPLRSYMLEYIYKCIREYWKEVFIYFCMEDAILWKKIIGIDPGCRFKFENYFMGGNKCIHF